MKKSPPTSLSAGSCSEVLRVAGQHGDHNPETDHVDEDGEKDDPDLRAFRSHDG